MLDGVVSGAVVGLDDRQLTTSVVAVVTGLAAMVVSATVDVTVNIDGVTVTEVTSGDGEVTDFVDVMRLLLLVISNLYCVVFRYCDDGDGSNFIICEGSL